jgi:hypothetical protein
MIEKTPSVFNTGRNTLDEINYLSVDKITTQSIELGETLDTGNPY